MVFEQPFSCPQLPLALLSLFFFWLCPLNGGYFSFGLAITKLHQLGHTLLEKNLLNQMNILLLNYSILHDAWVLKLLACAL